MADTLPKWHRELECFKAIKSTFILEGNLYDIYPYPEKQTEEGNWPFVELDEYLFRFLRENGYENVVFYNMLDGFFNKFSRSDIQTFRLINEGRYNRNRTASQSLPLQNSQDDVLIQADPEEAAGIIRTVLRNNQSPTAVILVFASRYIQSPDHLEESERLIYLNLLSASLNSASVFTQEKKRLRNLLFILPDKVNDIPAWFYLGNPYVKTILIPNPEKRTRQKFIDYNIEDFTGGSMFSPEDLEKFKDRFVGLTDGFKNLELKGLKNLCLQEDITIDKIHEAIAMYKYGYKNNPWNEVSAKKLENAEAYIKSRVKGQDAAVSHTLDIIKRAVTGFSGLQHSSDSSKPKGILFFAGPTGTGKTEMAKTLANLLFEDDAACIRFDMSEYQQSHSDQKLLGAPPGYVGYEAGGQLTNAVREKPFSILLFDEIEKAAPSILDKFLQILEDGRMTDGQGNTVYFSECIIIFTSNLGIYIKDEYGNRHKNVSPEMPYEEVREKVESGIKHYFNQGLGRPEILNRIGNNLVVFDYIRPESAGNIIQMQVKKITDMAEKSRRIHMELDPAAMDFLCQNALKNLENGGRGIGNVVEQYFINPLSRYLYDNKIAGDCSMRIKAITVSNNVAGLDCEVTQNV